MSQSSELAIDVKNITKEYTLGKLAPYAGLKRTVKRFIKRMLRMPSSPIAVSAKQISALNDVSFKVKKGEVVGIIGRNGAGKSTLLKILSRITSPTNGTIDVYGRIGALLEVGTGFHPELTGRENIFLNGSIIGMSKTEIARHFEEIVAFAELEQFIDTPVKHYSSGMYMRLAFAVSAHLSHEILVLDEVLAVGDSAFQQKCLAKMEHEANSGRTILFVSHDMGSIAAFCTRCLLLENGKLTMDGPPEAVVARYQENSVVKFGKVQGANSDDTEEINFKILTEHVGIPLGIRDALSRGERFGEGQARFTSCKLRYSDETGASSLIMRTGYNLHLDLSFEVFKPLVDAAVSAQICDRSGLVIADFSTAMRRKFIDARPGENLSVTFNIQNLRLRPDAYRLSIWIGRYSAFDADCIPMAAKIPVEMNPSLMKYPEVNFIGVYVCDFSMNIGRVSERSAPQEIE